MDVDAGGGESEDDVPPLPGQNKGPAKKKTASETYQKVSVAFHWACIASLSRAAIATRAHSQTPGFIHWEHRNDYPGHVDIRCRREAYGAPRGQVCAGLLQDC